MELELFDEKLGMGYVTIFEPRRDVVVRTAQPGHPGITTTTVILRLREWLSSEDKFRFIRG